MSTKRKDLTGTTFNYLTVKAFSHMNESGQSHWTCSCECGSEKVVRASHLKTGQIKSCGCRTKELLAAGSTKHGHWSGGVSSPEYSAWCLARTRCHNPGNQAYPDYGARGIKMCKRWRKGEGSKSGFECFIEDMGLRPSPKHSLDRIDNNKGYTPSNCRWATAVEQMRNTRGVRLVEFRGQEMCVSAAIEAAGSVIEIDRVVKRLNRGWSVEDAVTIPSLGRGGQR